MPTISNATVATGTGLSTAGNGGRKLVRLANGWLVASVKDTSTNVIYLKVDKQDGLGFVSLCHTQAVGNNGWTIVNKGTWIYLVYSAATGAGLVRFDATTVPNNEQTGTAFETGQSALDNVSLAINDAGTELHAAWSSKNGNYPNSFNIRYAKGTINGDGSVTWGAVEQVTKFNSNSYPLSNPCVVVTNNKPIIFVDSSGVFINANELGANSSSRAIIAFMTDSANTSKTTISNSWKGINVDYNLATHILSNPSALFVPAAINGLANGRLWVAWHGKDATDSAKFNVRVSYSDDAGVTWATPVKLTSGNTFDCQNVSLGADKNGKVFALYESHQWSPDIGIRMKTYNGSWGTEVGVATANTAEQYPSSLVDYSLMMTTPPTVYTDTTEGIKFVGNFNVGASVSPASGALGNKETATLTAYTVTPEAGSTVTQIVEKVNGVTVNTFNNPASLSRTLTVPTATWDTLAYFATHTASITVTDSNGATTVTTYSFDKRLATGASLLEATKANTDAKNRISQKRDALAAQVGLSAGSTFDAISAQLASGAFKKFQSGSGRTTTHNTSYTKDTVNGVAFTPSLVVIIKVGVYTGTAILQTVETSKPGWYSDGNTSSFDSYRFITGGSFGFFITGANATDYIWLAYGN